MGAASALGAVGDAIGAVGTVKSGIDTEKEARRQAEIAEQEGEAKAKLLAEEGKKFGAQQEMEYLKSGVLLTGSPLLVLAETSRKNLEDQASTRAAATERGQSLRRQGRSAFLSSIYQGTGQLFQAGAKAGGVG